MTTYKAKSTSLFLTNFLSLPRSCSTQTILSLLSGIGTLFGLLVLLLLLGQLAQTLRLTLLTDNGETSQIRLRLVSLTLGVQLLVTFTGLLGLDGLALPSGQLRDILDLSGLLGLSGGVGDGLQGLRAGLGSVVGVGGELAVGFFRV